MVMKHSANFESDHRRRIKSGASSSGPHPQTRHSGLDPESRQPPLDTGVRRYDDLDPQFRHSGLDPESTASNTQPKSRRWRYGDGLPGTLPSPLPATHHHQRSICLRQPT